MKILVTGSKGMIGSKLVQALINSGYSVTGADIAGEESITEQYCQYVVDLADKDKLSEIAKDADKIIHLAALAHTDNKNVLSWEKYKHINVDCARNVFEIAGNRPLLFISTVDVFGFFDGNQPVDVNSQLKPVSKYGKSKKMAEDECRKIPHYTIFRFSPVYTDTIKRDIQKRYYLKYPKIAYTIGKGSEYEILNVNSAVKAMVDWCSEEPKNDIKILKDPENMKTAEYIRSEKNAGRANIVLHFPHWMVNLGYILLTRIWGENEKTYLLNKAVHPLRSK